MLFSGSVDNYNNYNSINDNNIDDNVMSNNKSLGSIVYHTLNLREKIFKLRYYYYHVV